jgi:hypothetical protein
MQLDTLLADAREDVIDEAYARLEHSHVVHYERAGEAFTRQALEALFTVVVEAIRTKDLARLNAHVEHLAEERFDHGFDISEVQLAFNSLEVSMWRRLVSDEPLADLAEAVGLLSTVLGYGKDTLSRRYVSLAARRHVPSLDLSALFEGTNS